VSRDVYKGIGWGVKNQTLRHDLVNVQKQRFAKPSLRHLDNAKRSNFINYLQSKHNEINHQKQDLAHPKMFYLTGNRSEVRNFQGKEKPVTALDARRATLKKFGPSKRSSFSASQGAFPTNDQAASTIDSDRFNFDRKTLQSAIARRQAKANNHLNQHLFRGGDLSIGVLDRASSL